MLEVRAQAVLARLEEQDAREREEAVPRERRLRQVTPEVGRFLHTLVLATRPASVLEIGTSGGYSTIWLATAARRAGGRVVTLEIDRAKVRAARSNLEEAGVADAVSLVEGDAFAYLRERQEPADFVFLDAERKDYVSYLELTVPLLRVGGMLVADNVISHADDLRPFCERALSDTRLSGLVVPIGRGELVAVRVG